MLIRTLVLIVGMALFSLANAHCSRPLRKQMQSWPPYSVVDSAGRATGLDNDLLVLIANAAGCKVEFVSSTPGNRTMRMFKSGEIDILTGFSKTPERELFARYTVPYRDEVIALFTTSPNVEPGDIQSFSDITKHGLHLVAPLAGYYGQEFAISEGELQRKGALTRVEGDEKMVNMLIQGHGELIMGDEMVIPHVAKIMNLQNFHRMELEANRDMVYIGLSKASTTEQDQKALNSAIAKLLANGRIAAVIRHYREADR
jgi:polar amino acid transport system substrate-binding protein